MRRLLVASGLVLGTVMLVAGCGGSGKAPPPPNAEKIKMDMQNPGASLPPPPGTPGAPATKK